MAGKEQPPQSTLGQNAEDEDEGWDHDTDSSDNEFDQQPLSTGLQGPGQEEMLPSHDQENGDNSWNDVDSQNDGIDDVGSAPPPPATILQSEYAEPHRESSKLEDVDADDGDEWSEAESDAEAGAVAMDEAAGVTTNKLPPVLSPTSMGHEPPKPKSRGKTHGGGHEEPVVKKRPFPLTVSAPLSPRPENGRRITQTSPTVPVGIMRDMSVSSPTHDELMARVKGKKSAAAGVFGQEANDEHEVPETMDADKFAEKYDFETQQGAPTLGPRAAAAVLETKRQIRQENPFYSNDESINRRQAKSEHGCCSRLVMYPLLVGLLFLSLGFALVVLSLVCIFDSRSDALPHKACGPAGRNAGGLLEVLFGAVFLISGSTAVRTSLKLWRKRNEHYKRQAIRNSFAGSSTGQEQPGNAAATILADENFV